MLLLGNDFLAAHSANIKLNGNGDKGTISLSSATCEGMETQFNVSTGPRPESNATVAAALPSSGTTDPSSPVPLPRAKPLNVDFSRDPREPFSCPLIGQEAEIESLFGSADEFAARAPVSSSSEYLLYADQPLRIPSLSKATFLVPAPRALRDHSKCSLFVDRLPNRDGLVDTPLVVPAVATLTDDFKIRITIVNLSEKTTTIPHLQAVASLYVRFKIHDGYDGYTDGLSSSSEGKLTQEKFKLLDFAQIDPDNRLTPE
jgi:hypothetical protein